MRNNYYGIGQKLQLWVCLLILIEWKCMISEALTCFDCTGHTTGVQWPYGIVGTGDTLMSPKHQPMVIAYPPGSGGIRLLKKLCGSQFWNQNRGNHSHFGWDIQGMIALNSYPKYPVFSEDLVPIDTPEPLVSFHCLHGPTIAKIFPHRRIMRVRANLYLSLKRWWCVYGREYYQTHHLEQMVLFPLLQKTFTHCCHGILSHTSYYSTQLDLTNHELLTIAPGESEFADFMLHEFDQHRDDEFDSAWAQVLNEHPEYSKVMTSALI